jgi:hypothetical protein
VNRGAKEGVGLENYSEDETTVAKLTLAKTQNIFP